MKAAGVHVMIMTKLVKSLFHTIVTLGAVSPALAQAPDPCRAGGFEVKTFDSQLGGSGKAFDDAGSYRPGYHWYRWNWFNVTPKKHLSRMHSDGSLSAQGGFDGALVSAARSPEPPGFVGTAFGGGACVKIVLRFSPLRIAPSEGHPSFWAMSKEHLDGSGDDRWPGKSADFTHFAEWDILEYYKAAPPGFLSSWIDWFGPYIREGEVKFEGQTCRRPFCKRAASFVPVPGAFPGSTNWDEWQTVTGVWTPATAVRPGCIQTFLNDIPIAPRQCWKSLAAPRERMEEYLDFSVIDRHHMTLVISSGRLPIFVRSVEVYQESARDNLAN